MYYDTKNLLVALFIGISSDRTVMFDVLISCFSSERFVSSTIESLCSTNLLRALFKLFALKKRHYTGYVCVCVSVCVCV